MHAEPQAMGVLREDTYVLWHFVALQPLAFFAIKMLTKTEQVSKGTVLPRR